MNKRFFVVVLVVGLLFLSSSVSLVWADEILAEYSESNYSYGTLAITWNYPSDVARTSAVGESFQMGPSPKVITAVQFYLKCTPSPNGELSAFVAKKNSADNKPNMSDVLEYSINSVSAASINQSDFEMVTFVFSGTVQLDANAYYVVAVYGHDGGNWGNGVNCTNYGMDNTSPSYAGQSSNQISSGWNTATQDLIFRVYGESVDSDAPSFYAITASNVIASSPVALSCIVSDNFAIDDVIWSWNNTGTMVNQSAISASGTTFIANFSGIWQTNN